MKIGYIGLLLMLPVWIWGTPPIEKADRLFHNARDKEAGLLLENELAQTTSRAEKVQLYWQLSRNRFALGQGAETSQSKINFAQEGISLADKALELAPNEYRALFWKAAHLARLAKLKQGLSSLSRLKTARNIAITILQEHPDYLESYYLLGQLYAYAPKAPLSFGNVDQAVSLARYALKALEVQNLAYRDRKLYGLTFDLAHFLHKRNWSDSRRQRAQKKKRQNFFKKSPGFKQHCYYEGSLSLLEVGDRQEAISILESLVKQLSRMSNRDSYEQRNLEKARKIITQWR